jgi:hypothetical protein
MSFSPREPYGGDGVLDSSILKPRESMLTGFYTQERQEVVGIHAYILSVLYLNWTGLDWTGLA